MPGPVRPSAWRMVSVSLPAPKTMAGLADEASMRPPVSMTTLSSPPPRSSVGSLLPPKIVPDTLTVVSVMPSSTMACAPTASISPPLITLMVAVDASSATSTAWLPEDDVSMRPISMILIVEPSPSTTP